MESILALKKINEKNLAILKPEVRPILWSGLTTLI